MKQKNIIITVILSFLVITLYYLDNIYANNYEKANVAYSVYLNGKNLGLINDKDKLYDIINQEQEEIRNKYHVNNVYPPNGFDLVEVNTFHDNYENIIDIYNEMAKEDDFTIKGYIITIKFVPEDENEDGVMETKDDLVINVLDKNVFEEAIKKFVLAFVNESELNDYLNGDIKTISDIGQVINSMYFKETITIKEGYISSNSKIFTTVEELSQYLLFGPDAQMSSYTVKLGDDIESISEEYKLNPQEFIIANPIYRNESAILPVGTTVNVTLLDPILTYVYEVDRIQEVTIPYNTTSVTDSSKNYGYSEITQAGIPGLTKTHDTFQVINGEQSSEIKIISSEVIREKVDQVTTVGPKRPTYTPPSTSGSQILLDGDWTWPTNEPSIVTSKYGRRWGKVHEGIDISGTGYGSPVYAIGDGVVVITQKACSSCLRWSNGTYVVVRHDNDIYSAYLHLDSYNVSVGQEVKKGQRIASMGHSGYATGTHLHLGLFKGQPYSGLPSESLNPQKAIPAFNR